MCEFHKQYQIKEARPKGYIHYKVQKQAKLIYGDRNQNGTFFGGDN